MKHKRLLWLAGVTVVIMLSAVAYLVYDARQKEQNAGYVRITGQVERYTNMEAVDGPISVQVSGGYNFHLGGGLTPTPFLGETNSRYTEGDMVEVRAKLDKNGKLTVNCTGCYVKKK